MQTGVTIADMVALYAHYRTKDNQTNEDNRRLKRVEALLDKLTDGLKENPKAEPMQYPKAEPMQYPKAEPMRWGE